MSSYLHLSQRCHSTPNDYYLSLSTYTFPAPSTPPLCAAITPFRTPSTHGLTRALLFDASDARESRAMPYVLPRSSSLPALRLRSASAAAPPPPLPPYHAEVYAYGTYVSPVRRASEADDAPNEVLRDEWDADGDADAEGCEGMPGGEQVDFKMMLKEEAEDALRVTVRRNKGFDPSTRSMYPTKPGWVLPTSRSAPLIPTRPKISTFVDDAIDFNAIDSALSASSSSSSSDSQSPLSPALYNQIDPLDTRFISTEPERHTGSAEEMDIYSALRWSKSVGTARPTYLCRQGAPQLPPIPKMVDLMVGLFTTYSTPERQEGRSWEQGRDESECLTPSYTTSTSFPNLYQLASPFLNPRAAPSPPCLSLPAAVARTPTVSRVQPVPSCFPSIESSDARGLNALGFVVEDPEIIEKQFEEDPFAGSFADAIPDRTPAVVPRTETKPLEQKRSRRHSYRPTPAAYTPYTPPHQVRSVPLRSAPENIGSAFMGMSRSMSNLHLPLRDTSSVELVSKFDHDDDDNDANVGRTPFNRIGRSLTRTRSGLGALLATAKSKNTPQTPGLAPKDLAAETPVRMVQDEKEKNERGIKSVGRVLRLDKLDGRWIRMGLGRRRSSD